MRKKGPETRRRFLMFSNASSEDLRVIREKTEAMSDSEVVHRALRLTKMVVCNEATVYKKDPRTGALVEVEFLF